MERTSILFVCLGNICRSPLAEGVFRGAVEIRGWTDRFVLDSAGTGGWCEGSPPDPRSIAVAARYGVDIAGQRARKLQPGDFDRFDLLLGMDRSNVDHLRQMAGPHIGKAHQFIEYATGERRDVPDPYYGGADGFEQVYRMIRNASEALADRLGARLSEPSIQASSIT